MTSFYGRSKTGPRFEEALKAIQIEAAARKSTDRG
jgi:hypothetical protein